MRYNRVSFDIIVVGRFAPHALDRREGWARARFAAFALDRGDQRRFLAADKRTGAFTYFQIEREIRAEDIFAQEAELARLGDGDVQVLYRDGIFRPAINVAQACTRGVGGDNHAFQHRVRVAFEHTPVHERARVALVRVTGQVFRAVWNVPAQLPLFSSREAGTATSAQAGLHDMVNHLLRRHLGYYFCQRAIAIFRNIILDIVWIDLAAVTQYHTFFLGLGRA